MFRADFFRYTSKLVQISAYLLIAKKASGMKLGRPKGIGKSKLDQYRLEIEALLNNGSTQALIAKRYGTTEANLHHWLKQRGLIRMKEFQFYKGRSLYAARSTTKEAVL